MVAFWIIYATALFFATWLFLLQAVKAYKHYRRVVKKFSFEKDKQRKQALKNTKELAMVECLSWVAITFVSTYACLDCILSI